LGPRERDNVTRLSRLCCFQGSSAGDRSAGGDEPRLRLAPTQSRESIQYRSLTIAVFRPPTVALFLSEDHYTTARGAVNLFFGRRRPILHRRGPGRTEGRGDKRNFAALLQQESPPRSKKLFHSLHLWL